jgi:hypothetical protein
MDIQELILSLSENKRDRQNYDVGESAESELPGNISISKERELLFQQARGGQNALWTTFNRYYTGARYVGYLSWITTALTAIIGALLLALISENQSWWVFTETSVTLLLVAVSLLSAFYSPQARSVKYYHSGQQLQEIYDEYENFVNLEITDLSRDVQNLRKEYDRLHRQRHLANQGAPQLSGIWYQLLNKVLGTSPLSRFITVLAKIKKQTLGRVKDRWGKSETESDDSSDNEQEARYQHSCGSDKPDWEETLCEKIVNYGHPAGHSEERK